MVSEGMTSSHIDARELRKCLAQFATGVTVVTYSHLGTARGVTVNAFTSVSLEPPLVLISLARTARSCERLRRSGFAVNVLATHQRDTALRFAHRSSDPGDGRWLEGCMAPYLDGCVAVLQCKPWGSHDAGDHVLHIGRVQELHTPGGTPLIFHDGNLIESEPAVSMTTSRAH
jgi:flavin reductase (DIM6/NTAB) family NADH-FMN oxidoreductase RutF